MKSLSRVRLLVTPRTAAYQAPPSMGFSRQEYWSGVPLPSPTGRFRQMLTREGRAQRQGRSSERNSSAASGQVLIPSGDTQTGSLSCFADTESPTRWEKLTVRRPQERGAQTCWNQKVEDEDSRLPHHPPVRGKSTPALNHGSTTPHYPHQVGTHVVLRASTRPGPLCLAKP